MKFVNQILDSVLGLKIAKKKRGEGGLYHNEGLDIYSSVNNGKGPDWDDIDCPWKMNIDPCELE